MPAVLNTNVASLMASKNLLGAQSKLADSVERLSSGLRINRAKDDAAGSAGVGLSASIARARDIGYDALAEECLLIADTPQFGQKQVMTDEGTATTIEDMLGHRKLQIETRLKLLAKFHPTKYGDKTIVAGDPNGAPIKTEETSSGRLFEIIRNLEMSKRAG